MDEKARVKQALQASLILDKVWLPIATAWFDKWKAYVNFDAVADDQKVEGRYPGPADNGPLQGSFGDELRRDLVVDRDYVLLPKECAESLLRRYGGGPRFPRKVKCADTFNGRSMEVDLWPVRVHLYLCDRSHPTPDPLGPSFQRRYYLSGVDLQYTVTDAKTRWFGFNDINTPTRCWLRETPPQSNVTATGMGRRLTNDIVEWDGGWHVIRSTASNRRLRDIRGNGEYIELIVEVAPCRDPKPSDWPRFHLLEAWKRGIRMDDMIDARDAQGHFNAATVIHVREAGDLVVRYWAGGDDEWILAGDFDCRIAPLHSHSSDTSKPTVDMTAPSALVTRKRSRETPSATSDDDDDDDDDDAAGGAAQDHGAEQVVMVQFSEGVSSKSGTETPPLTANIVHVPMDAAHVVLAIHLRRALHAHGITPPRVEAVLQVLRDEEVSSLVVWQALTHSEVSSLLETHRETFPVGLRTAMRLIHGATAPL